MAAVFWLTFNCIGAFLQDVIAAAFFPKYSGFIMVGIYFGGILMGILVAILSKSLMFRGEAVPFVMELPNYRMPGAGNVLRLLYDKAKDFIQRAFTIIFLATIVIWFLQTFDVRLCMVEDAKDSILPPVRCWHSAFCIRHVLLQLHP